MNKKIGAIIVVTVALVAVISGGVIWLKRKGNKSEQK